MLEFHIFFTATFGPKINIRQPNLQTRVIILCMQRIIMYADTCTSLPLCVLGKHHFGICPQSYHEHQLSNVAQFHPLDFQS